MSDPIHSAIHEVMKQVGYVQKARSGGLNYSFAGEAALIAALRPAMVEQGLYMIVVKLDDVRRTEYTTAKGATMQMVDLTATVRFTHAPSGTYIDVVALGSGADSGDKASNKALTGAYKYALRQTFCIETGDDPDREASEPRGAVRKVDQATGEVKSNGHAPAPLSKLWPRWSELVTEAQTLGLPVPNMDVAASDDEIIRAGKALGSIIKAAKLTKEANHA